MKLKTRIQLICFIMASIIVLISATILMFYIPNSLKMSARSSTEAVNKQTLLVLNNIIDSLNITSRLPVLDPEIYAIMHKDYTEYPEEMRKYYKYKDKDLITSNFYTDMYYRNQYVSAITLINSDEDMVSFKQKESKSPNISNLEQQEWYHRLLKSNEPWVLFPTMTDELYAKNGDVISIGRIFKDAGTGKKLGILKVDIMINDLKSVWDNAMMTSETHLVLVDKNRELVYTTLNPENGEIKSLLNQTIDDGKNEVIINGKSYIATVTRSDKYGYALLSMTLLDVIYQDANHTMKTIFVVALLCIAGAFLLAEIFSTRVMKPIRELNDRMKEVRLGDLTVRASVNVGGEFGMICESFNSMVENTEQLIARIYKEEEKKHEAEYTALQAQISPHFMMNTINTIKWMAFLQGNKSIESALNSLSCILRFAVKEKSDKITIDTEIQQMEYYIHILSIRYPNRFNFHFEIQPEVRNCLTLKYMLQPIVENCVFHGLDNQEDEGIIEVKIYLDGQNKIVYEVRDNGKGMSQERIDEVLNHEAETTKGVNKIGVYNVNQRIKMVFGEQYGISIDSMQGEYTLVKIEIPAEKKQEAE